MTDGAADRLHDTDDGLSRRQLGASVLALSGALALAPFPAGPAAAADTHTDGHADGLGTTLRRGSPERAGLIAGHLRQLVADAEKFLAPSPKHPWYAGAVLLAGRGGTVALHQPIGKAVRYSAYDDKTDTGVEFPADQQIAAAEDTVYDLASVSKLFTSLIAVQEIERGKLELEATVASYIPDFAGGGKQDITIRQLLTHTSGFRAWIPLYKETTREGKLRLIWDEAPLNPPGTVYLYSDLNLISLQLVLEKLTGQTLDVLLRERITGPLGMRRTRYNPPASWKPKIAATEDARLPWSGLDRGLVWGEVHDENAFGLGGVAGHAGVFSCAWDLAILGRTLLNGGSYGKARILSEDSVRAAVHRLQPGVPRRRARPRLRALPALVHGRDGDATHGRAHRLHRHVHRPRPDDRLVPHRARQLRPSRAHLAIRLRSPGRRGEQPRPRRRGTPRARAHRLVLRHGERHVGDAHAARTRRHLRHGEPRLRPVVGHGTALRPPVSGGVGRRRGDLAAPAVHDHP